VEEILGSDQRRNPVLLPQPETRNRDSPADLDNTSPVLPQVFLR